jgi:hypothetical protein
MPSLEIKPISIALFPTAADRTTARNAHQQYYLSPPLTPFPHISSYNDIPKHSSPVLPPNHATLPALQDMIPHENRQRNLSTDQERFHQHSALQQHAERDRKENMEHNSVTAYHSGQPMTDPARILPLYTAQPHNSVPQTSSIISPLVRRNKAHVASACVNCKKAHLACDGIFPHPFCPITSIYGCNVSPFLRYRGYNAERGCMSSDACAPCPIFRFFFYSLLLFYVFFLALCGSMAAGGPVPEVLFHRLQCPF